MAVGLSSQERFPVRKWRLRTVLALFSAAGNREWTDHLPSKTRNTYVMINETNPENGVNGFYQELNEEGQQQENEAPDQGEARRFWSDIWRKEVEHNKDAEWLEDFRHVMSDTQQQENIEITVEKVRKMVQKIP